MTEVSELDARIVASWEELESADPNISTEYLAYLVEQTTGADYRRQIEALTNAGFFARRIAEISVEDMDDET